MNKIAIFIVLIFFINGAHASSALLDGNSLHQACKIKENNICVPFIIATYQALVITNRNLITPVIKFGQLSASDLKKYEERAKNAREFLKNGRFNDADGDLIASAGLFLQFAALDRNKPPPGACLPSPVENSQVIDVVKKYLADNPKARHLPALTLIVNALTQAFPCRWPE